VRDYRRCSSEKGASIVSTKSSPIVRKVCLKMSLENILKDIIPSLTHKSWTYGDIMVSIIHQSLMTNIYIHIFFEYRSHLTMFSFIIGSWIKDCESITSTPSSRSYSKVESTVSKFTCNKGINKLVVHILQINLCLYCIDFITEYSFRLDMIHKK